MKLISNLIQIILHGGLIVGMFSPAKVLFWSKSPSRIKVFGYWFGILLLIVFVWISIEDSKPKSKSQSKEDKVEIINGVRYENENDDTKEYLEDRMKSKLSKKLPFNHFKYACIENGYGVIVDNNWCFWINKNGVIYCVNGMSKGPMRKENGDRDCEDAPIKAGMSEIEELAK